MGYGDYLEQLTALLFLKLVNEHAQPTNNASVRKRFGIGDANSAMASRLLKEAEQARVIRQFDPEAAPKLRRYVPHWA